MLKSIAKDIICTSAQILSYYYLSSEEERKNVVVTIVPVSKAKNSPTLSVMPNNKANQKNEQTVNRKIGF